VRVTETALKTNHIIFDCAAHGVTVRQPHRQSLSNLVDDSKQTHFLANFAMIALQRQLPIAQKFSQFGLTGKSSSIDTREHFVGFTSPPIGTSNA